VAFALKTEECGGVLVLILNGYVDKKAADTIKDSISARVKTGSRRFVLDFAMAPLVNSSALAELIDLVSQCITDTSLRYVFCGLSQACRFSFNTVGIFLYVKDTQTRLDAEAAAAA